MLFFMSMQIMNLRAWAIWFLAGIFLHVADIWLTIQLLESQQFYEGNILLRWFFDEGHYLSVFAIKNSAWLIIMLLAIHPVVSRWMTPVVVRVSTIGLGTIVGWNLGWYIRLDYMI